MSKKTYSHDECRQLAENHGPLMAQVVEQLVGDAERLDAYKTKWETNELHAEQMRGNVQGLRSALVVVKTDLKESKIHRDVIYGDNDRLRLEVEALNKKLQERLDVLTETSAMCGEAQGARDAALVWARIWKRMASRLFIRNAEWKWAANEELWREIGRLEERGDETAKRCMDARANGDDRTVQLCLAEMGL
jgi:hypothetical protein